MLLARVAMRHPPDLENERMTILANRRSGAGSYETQANRFIRNKKEQENESANVKQGELIDSVIRRRRRRPIPSKRKTNKQKIYILARLTIWPVNLVIYAAYGANINEDRDVSRSITSRSLAQSASHLHSSISHPTSDIRHHGLHGYVERLASLGQSSDRAAVRRRLSHRHRGADRCDSTEQRRRRRR